MSSTTDQQPRGQQARNRQPYRRLATLAVLLPLLLTGCTATNPENRGQATGQAPGQESGEHGESGPEQPVKTTDADWKPVTDTLGRTGKFGDNNTVYRITLARTDLHVDVGGTEIKPGLSLGGYAAFAKYRDESMVMGDLVVTETELPKVTDALQSHGITQTAIHKHLPEQAPAVWWTHIQGTGDPAKLADGVKAALDATAIPKTPPAAGEPSAPGLDTAGIDAALGRKGTAEGGIYKFSLPRAETISDSGYALPPTFGVTTGVNFQPADGGKAAVNGDFAMTGPEVQKVIQTLRAGGISVVSLHNHALNDQPRLFYAHFWAVNDAVTLAKALRPALDATNLKAAG